MGHKHRKCPVRQGCSRTPVSPDRNSNFHLKASGLLILLLLLGRSAAAQHLTSDPGHSPAGACQTGGDAISLEDLARRLQHLERQNAKLATQNDKMAEENAKLSGRSQLLSEKLEEITKLYDDLNRRL